MFGQNFGLVNPFQASTPQDPEAKRRYEIMLADRLKKRQALNKKMRGYQGPYHSKSVGATRALAQTLGGALEGYRDKLAAKKKAEAATAQRKMLQSALIKQGYTPQQAYSASLGGPHATGAYAERRAMMNLAGKRAEGQAKRDEAVIAARNKNWNALRLSTIKSISEEYKDYRKGNKIGGLPVLRSLRTAWANSKTGGLQGWIKQQVPGAVAIGGNVHEQFAYNLTQRLGPTMHIAGATSNYEYEAYRSAFGSLANKKAANLMLSGLALAMGERQEKYHQIRIKYARALSNPSLTATEAKKVQEEYFKAMDEHNKESVFTKRFVAETAKVLRDSATTPREKAEAEEIINTYLVKKAPIAEANAEKEASKEEDVPSVENDPFITQYGNKP